jgi:arylsulfatase A-like enzyme
LGEILKNHGYFNFLCSGHDNILFGIIGFQRGFDKWTINKGFMDAKKINELALSFLEQKKKQKFFLWLHYMDTHDSFLGFPQEKHFIENITPEEINIYSAKYDEAINYVDSQIGILLNKLKSLGLYKNTLVILTADHGQEMCEHGICFNHGGFLWDSLIRVPLIIFYPKLFPKNKIITQQVQHIDIIPTICDILKIKKYEFFEGKSLLPLVNGRSIHSTYAFSEHKENINDLSTGSWIYTKISVRSPEWKLIYTYDPQGKEEYELYNLKNDTQELNNLVDIEEERFQFLRTKLEEWMNRPRPKITPLTKSLDEKTKERLKSLGYLQ